MWQRHVVCRCRQLFLGLEARLPTLASPRPAPHAGSISSDFGATHDWRGQPRVVSSQQGVVAADHGRCSDAGEAWAGVWGEAPPSVWAQPGWTLLQHLR